MTTFSQKHCLVHYELFRKGFPTVASWIEAAKDLTDEQLLDGLAHNPSAYAQQLLLACAYWHRFGCQVFSVGPRFREMLCNTSLKGVPWSEMELPFPSFYVHLPDCDWRIWGGTQTGWHKVSGLYVTDHTLMGGEELRRIVLMLWGDANEASRNRYDDAMSYVNLSPYESQRRFEDLEEYTAWVVNERSKKGVFEIDGFGNTEETNIESNVILDCLRVVFNLAQYLKSQNAETSVARQVTEFRAKLEKDLKRAKKGTNRRLKAEKQLQKQPSPITVTYCGSSLETASLPSVPGRGLVRRHWVRGHWKRIWYASREKHETRWILPYLRGVEGENEVEGRIYKP